MEEMHCIVTGRVQRVMYRDFVKRGARALGIRGWVRNLSDGTVEVLAQGEPARLSVLESRMKKGPLLSRVDSVKTERREPSHTYGRFVIIR